MAKKAKYLEIIFSTIVVFPTNSADSSGIKIFCAKLKEMEDFHAVFAQGHLLFRQQPFDEIDQCDVVADEQDALDGRVLLHKQSGPVNQNKGLTGSRRAGDNPVAAVDFAGDGFLVLIQHF